MESEYAIVGSFFNSTSLFFYYLPISEIPQLTENNYLVVDIKLSYITNLVPESDIRWHPELGLYLSENTNNYINSKFRLTNDSGTYNVTDFGSSSLIELSCIDSILNFKLSNLIEPNLLFRDTFLTAHIQILSFNKEINYNPS